MSVPSRFWPNYSKPVAAKAKFRPGCGATLPAPQAAPRVPQAPAHPSYRLSYQTPYQQPAKSNAKIIIILVIIIVLLVASFATYAEYTFSKTLPTIPTQHSLAVANGNYAIPASHYYYLTFVVPTSANMITVNGTFDAKYGTVMTLVMDQTNFATYQNNGMGTFYYESGTAHSGFIFAKLPSSGTYDLVYVNTFGYNETVQTVVTAYYH